MSRSPAPQLAQLLDRSLTLHSVRELPLAELIVLDVLLEQWARARAQPPRHPRPNAPHRPRFRGVTVSSGPNELRQLADHAEDRLRIAIDLQRQLLDLFRRDGFGNTAVARSLSIAITHAETSCLWLHTATTHSGEV